MNKPQLLPILAMLALSLGAFGQTPAKASSTLTLSPRMLDFEGSRQLGAMYMPSAVDLSDKKPSTVKNEPSYLGKPLYGVITVGDGPKSKHTIVIDPGDGTKARVYVDRNADGDLTNDQSGAWDSQKTSDSGVEYSGTFIFRASYGTPTKETSSGVYGLNFYYMPARNGLFYYRASTRNGSIQLNGQKYSVQLIENNNDGVFNTPFLVGGKPTKPVWLVLDGKQFDARGTFSVGGYNYEALLSADGSRITLQPTMKAVTEPVVQAKEPDLLAVGTDAPDFEVPAADGGTVRLSSLRGKIVVLDFWATWCGPCKASLPHVQKVQEKVADQNVYVLALNVWDAKQPYDTWLTKNKQYTFHFAFDPAGKGETNIAKSKYNVSGIPTTYVIGTDGKIAASILGFEGLDDHRLETALSALGVNP